METRAFCEPSPTQPSRRTVLGTALAAAVAAWAGRSALAQIETSSGHRGNVVVTLFLRGGMDGLSMVVPHGIDEYHKQRPTLSLGTPKRNGVVDLDGRFGLHPVLQPLKPFWAEGKLAVLHGVGSLDQSRSHFEAMATMERGAGATAAEVPSGWLARALDIAPDTRHSPLRALTIGAIFPDILRGASGATQIHSLDEIKLAGTPTFATSLARLYDGADDAVAVAGRDTLSLLKTLEKLDPKRYTPERGATYPKTDLGEALRQTAILIKADVGLQACALDRFGWDTHVTQGGATGYLAGMLDELGKALAAFGTDLGPELDRVTVVVMTEFGRRVPENSQLGTDHGRASAWLALGGGVKGGKVYERIKSLKPADLEGPGDLPVTTDYRDILTELAAQRLGVGARARDIFPGAPGTTVGVFA